MASLLWAGRTAGVSTLFRSLYKAKQNRCLILGREVSPNFAECSRFCSSTSGTADQLPAVTLVQDADTAQRVAQQLATMKDHFHACDTEVADIDLKKTGPVGHGKVICLSVYSGPDVDFGNGPRLWVENLDESEGVLQYFKPFLEDPSMKKVWHNYSFDRHVLANEGIRVGSLGADTMHMARLWDSSRKRYSLEELSHDVLGRRKRPMSERFAVPVKRKDGSDGKKTIIPPVRELQREEQWRDHWIDYSCYDAEATWMLRQRLEELLKRQVWKQEKTMFDFYETYLAPFGVCLADMEEEGVRVNQALLARVEVEAVADSGAVAEEVSGVGG